MLGRESWDRAWPYHEEAASSGKVATSSNPAEHILQVARWLDGKGLLSLSGQEELASLGVADPDAALSPEDVTVEGAEFLDLFYEDYLANRVPHHERTGESSDRAWYDQEWGTNVEGWLNERWAWFERYRRMSGLMKRIARWKLFTLGRL